MLLPNQTASDQETLTTSVAMTARSPPVKRPAENRVPAVEALVVTAPEPSHIAAPLRVPPTEIVNACAADRALEPAEAAENRPLQLMRAPEAGVVHCGLFA